MYRKILRKKNEKRNRHLKSNIAHLVVFCLEGSIHYCRSTQGEKKKMLCYRATNFI